jgi:tetratricopeptide (TPR) repeat protein
MSLLDGASSIDIFAATSQGYAQLETLSQNALTSGIDRYMQEDYRGAIKEFTRAVGLAPDSTYSVDAAIYMAQGYLQLNDPENAIKAYKTAIRLNPYRDDTHAQLGNLLFDEERFDEAIREYKEAVRVNPSASNYYTLGQGYLATGSYSSAETQFNKVLGMAPTDPAGNHGLGLSYSQQGRYEDAIRQFETAIQKDNEFYDAYAEIGYAYADLGMMDEAQIQVDSLEHVNPSLADALSRYMYKVDPPKMMFPHADSTFLYTMPNNTNVSALNSYLINADASKSFTMVFQFDKQMDRESVENRINWQIGRSTLNGIGQAYNFGLPTPSTEITVSPYPENVYWDEEELRATVTFSIQQNATADGTIDPSHIEFKFTGKDVYGNSMDEDFDQFIGFSGVA